MRNQVRHWKNPNAEKAFVAKQQKKTSDRLKDVQMIAHNIVQAVIGHSEGVVFERGGKETLLIRLAQEIGVGQYSRTRTDVRIGHNKYANGELQKLLRDAVDYAVKQGKLLQYFDLDGTAAVYLPGREPAKWRVFFADRSVRDNYIPTKRECEPHTTSSHDDTPKTQPLDGRLLARVRKWGEENVA